MCSWADELLESQAQEATFAAWSQILLVCACEALGPILSPMRTPLQAVRLYKEPGRQAHFFSQMTQFSLPQVPHEKVHPIWEGNKTQQIEKQMHSSILGQKLPIRKMLRRTDAYHELIVSWCCNHAAFWINFLDYGPPCGIFSPPSPPTMGKCWTLDQLTTG